jgi:uncharacterized protein
VKVYRLERDQWVPRPLPDIFRFFSDARNLAQITPPKLRFEILDAPAEIHAGTLIRYRLRPFGVPIRWSSKIAQWDPPRLFQDIQISGPYRLWEHTHRFEESGGRTHILDQVLYALPLGWLGRAVHPAVKRNLDGIFEYRRRRIASMFGEAR